MTFPAPTKATDLGMTHRLRPRDVPILRALLRFHFLTPEQITCLLYASGSLTYAYTKLKRLADSGHVLRLPMLKPEHSRGAARYAFALAGSGLAHLKQLGDEIPEAFRLHDPKRFSYLFYDHWLALSDVLIAASLLPQRRPQTRLDGLIHDRELKVLLAPTTRSTHAVPDGLLQLVVQMDPRRARLYPILLEVDRDTVSRRDWLEKLRSYLSAFGSDTSPFAQRFDAAEFTLAITTPSRERAQTVRSLIAALLSETGNQDLSDAFLITHVDPATVPPEDFFLAPVWHAPLAEFPMPLLELPRPLLVVGKGGG
jgi:hypothetical protein